MFGYDHTMLAIPLLVPISAVKQHRAISSTVVGDQTETNGVVVSFFLPHLSLFPIATVATTTTHAHTAHRKWRAMALQWLDFDCHKGLLIQIYATNERCKL